jgi:hypothetical protein
LLSLAQLAPIPPVFLLLGKMGIASLGDGAAKNVEAADVMLGSGSLAKPSIKLIAVLQR